MIHTMKKVSIAYQMGMQIPLFHSMFIIIHDANNALNWNNIQNRKMEITALPMALSIFIFTIKFHIKAD